MSLKRNTKTDPPPNSNVPPSPEFLEQIAVRAYFKAAARGFAPGFETEDWLEAEAEQRESTKGE